MTKVYDVFPVHAYRRGTNEDGHFEWCIGYNVVAKSVGDDGLIREYVYCGLDNLHKIFDINDAEHLVDRVLERGYIDENSYWDCVKVIDPKQLPDWARYTEHDAYN